MVSFGTSYLVAVLNQQTTSVWIASVQNAVLGWIDPRSEASETTAIASHAVLMKLRRFEQLQQWTDWGGVLRATFPGAKEAPRNSPWVMDRLSLLSCWCTQWGPEAVAFSAGEGIPMVTRLLTWLGDSDIGVCRAVYDVLHALTQYQQSRSWFWTPEHVRALINPSKGTHSEMRFQFIRHLAQFAHEIPEENLRRQLQRSATAKVAEAHVAVVDRTS
jgi:hypothetical protein